MDEGLGVPTDAYVTLLDALANGILAIVAIGAFPTPGFNIIPARLVIKGASTPPITVTGQVSKKRWATQRKRGSFGKANSIPF
jgi:hypothetical protein